MHRSITSSSRPRPRQLARLCAACARDAAAPSPPLRLFSCSPSLASSPSIATGSALQPSPASTSRPRPRLLAAAPAACPAACPAPPPPTARRFFKSAAAARSAAQGSRDAAAEDGGGLRGNGGMRQKNKDHPGEPDYYALFPQTLAAGPPPEGPFEIDVRALRREFLQLQAAVHPDFHHHAAAASPPSPGAADAPSDDGHGTGAGRGRHSVARRRAEAASSHINAAYRTLSSPLQRAQYLLRSRHGLDLAGDEAASLARPDTALLAEVMMVREDIEDAETEEDLEPIRARNEERVAACEAALAAAFAADDPAAAVAQTVRLKYWLNVRETLDNWEAGRPVVVQH